MYTLPSFYIYTSDTSIPFLQINTLNFSYSVSHNHLISFPIIDQTNSLSSWSMFTPRWDFVRFLSSPSSLATIYSTSYPINFHFPSIPVFQYYNPVKHIQVFHLFQYSFHYSIHLSPLFPLRLSSLKVSRTTSLYFQVACMHSSCCASICLRRGTVAPSYRWYTTPLGWSSTFAFLALPNLHFLPVCHQFPLLTI